MDIEAYAPFALLIGALLALLLSTRQFPTFVRLPIWMTGLGLLTSAGWFALHDQYPGAFGLISDAFQGNPLNSALVATLTGNLLRLNAHLSSMFAIFFVMASALAVIALLAFTRGEQLEKALRPLFYATIGAIGGGFLALIVVALGLGGYQKDRTYAARASEVGIIDGDTIRMGDVTLRLWGIDAPEHNQICLSELPFDATKHPTCGERAAEHLKGLIAGTYLVCSPPNGREIPQETFGRPLVRCNAYGKGVRDIALQMAEDGYADVYRENDRKIVSTYCAAVKKAQAPAKGLWKLGMLYPWQWRNDPAGRESFLDLRQVSMIDLLLDQCALQKVAAK